MAELKYVAELGENLFISQGTGINGLTRNRELAKKYATRRAAWSAIGKVQRLNPGEYPRPWVGLKESKPRKTTIHGVYL